MSHEHLLALRRALIRAETEIANARHELAEKEEELDKLRVVFPPPRTALRWPWGCLAVRACMDARACAKGCPTHVNRDLQSCIKDALAVARMVACE